MAKGDRGGQTIHKMCDAVAWKKGGSGTMAEQDKKEGLEGTACISGAVGEKGKMVMSVVCGGVGGGERKSGEEDDAESTRADATKRGCEGGEEEENRKRSKREVVVEGEEAFEIESRYGEYLYEKWMWGSMRENRFAFSSVSMWYWLARLKEQLWRRYNIFYDADAIDEVYPENEIAGWV